MRTGGRPYLYIRPGCNTRSGESKFGVDYFDNKKDVQAYARQRYGWRGNDTLAGTHTPPNETTQSMVVTPSPNRLEVVCPIYGVVVTTYTQKDDASLPLTTDGIVDWYRPWPKGTENPLRLARAHYVGKHLGDGILPNGTDTPLGIRYKNKKRNIEMLSGQRYDFPAYYKVRNFKR